MDRVLRHALRGLEGQGIRIEYRTPDGKRHLGDTDFEGSENVLALLYADDLVVVCDSVESLNEVTMRFEESTQLFGLTISVKKTKYLVTSGEEERNEVDVDLVLRGEKVERVDNFVYLGSTISEEASSTKEIDRRIGLGTSKFYSMKKIWKQKEISRSTKLRFYRTLILPTVLYGAGTWTCGADEYRKLNTFHNDKLRSILGRKGYRKLNEYHIPISNDKLYRKTFSWPLENEVRKLRLRWAGHVRRLPNTRLPKKILFGDVAGGKCKRGRKPINWIKCVEDDCEVVGISTSNWPAKAKDRKDWLNSFSSLTSCRSNRRKRKK